MKLPCSYAATSYNVLFSNLHLCYLFLFMSLELWDDSLASPPLPLNYSLGENLLECSIALLDTDLRLNSGHTYSLGYTLDANWGKFIEKWLKVASRCCSQWSVSLIMHLCQLSRWYLGRRESRLNQNIQSLQLWLDRRAFEYLDQ